MGKRGPAPAPTALKALRGGKPDPGEPVPDKGEVRMPRGLSRGAKAAWRRLAPDLVRKGVLTPWDVDGFATFCDALARAQEARRRLDQEGEVVDLPVFGKNGELTGHRRAQNPWFQVLKAANDTTMRFGARFGLSPSDRAQLKVGDGKTKTGKGRLLTG